MLKVFKRQKLRLLGMDIRSSAIHALELEESKSKVIVKQFFVEPLIAGAITDGEISEPKAVTAALRRLKTKIHHQSNCVALAVNGSAVVSKQVSVEAGLNDLDIERCAWAEAKKYFPHIIDDICLDFHIAGPHASDPSLLQLSLVACRENFVESRCRVAWDAGFDIRVMDVDYYALQRALRLLVEPLSSDLGDRTIGILHLEYTRSVWVVVRGQEILQSRSSVQENRATVAAIKEQLAQFLQFTCSSGPISIDQIVLCGECALIPELAPLLEAQQSIPVLLGNPFVNAQFETTVDADLLMEAGPAFLLCSGLALIEPYDR